MGEKDREGKRENEETRAEDRAAEDVGDLQKELAEKEQQMKEYIDRIKHLQADFENYKKRALKEREDLDRLIEDRMILEFIPIYDNFERAFRSFNHNNDKDSFIEGMERIFSQFDDLVAKKGVEKIEALGERFDPARHEALIAVESDEEPNIVLEEFERGYLRNGRVIKPSRVKVSKVKSKTKEEKEE